MIGYQNFLAWFYWDPNRVAFYLPWFNHPVAWYGILFVTGFIFGYFMLVKMLTQKLAETIPSPSVMAYALADKLLWYLILGTIIGARLGEVFFYEWDAFKAHPWDIFKIWEGGLASHGGFLGVIIAIALFYLRARRQVPQVSLLNWMDMLVVPISLVCSFIRIGNFVNQEIIGRETDVPWAVIFGHPAEMASNVPRHPVQLYEAIAYLCVFLVLCALWRFKKQVMQPGLLCGIGILLLGIARFALEAFKLPQQTYINQSYLEVGQILSIPYLLFGCALCIYALMSKRVS